MDRTSRCMTALQWVSNGRGGQEDPEPHEGEPWRKKDQRLDGDREDKQGSSHKDEDVVSRPYAPTGTKK